MFNTMIKMFRSAEKEARAFQKTIAKEQKTYYKNMKKAEKLAKKAEKKEFLAICSDIARMFKKCEPKEKKQRVIAANKVIVAKPVVAVAMPTIVQNDYIFEVECGNHKIVDEYDRFALYINDEYVDELSKENYQSTFNPIECVISFIMKNLCIRCETFRAQLNKAVRQQA